ncbi:MAG: HAD family hydrolase [Agriterribacter sp.]
MSKSIAFFDFDGTITYKDTLIEIIKFSRGTQQLYKGLLALSPWLIAMKLKLFSNQSAKEKFLSYFLKNMPENVFQEKCNEFTDTRLPQLIRPLALQSINELKKKGTRIIIVSASPRNWIEPWCLKNKLGLISTVLETKGGKITGNIAGKNCYGEEKVNRIKEQFDLSTYNEIFCYGDTEGDKPMLSLATSAYYKPFR